MPTGNGPHVPPAKDQMVLVPGDRPYILIVPGDDGSVQVRGPLNNPTFCFGLLEMARVQVTARVLENFRLEGGHIALDSQMPPTPGGG